MDAGTRAAIISAAAAVVAAVLLFLGTRKGHQNTEDADVRRWANELLTKVQEAHKELDNVRREAHALADELRAVRTEAWREESMPRFREWLARRPDPVINPHERTQPR